MIRDRLGRRIVANSVVLCVNTGEVFWVEYVYRSGMEVIYLGASVYSMDRRWHRPCFPSGVRYEVLYDT